VIDGERDDRMARLHGMVEKGEAVRPARDGDGRRLACGQRPDEV
jgi:hypothetical protein